MARVRPIRIGVMEHESSTVRLFLGLTASRDGGVIVWPRPIPDARWSYGRAEVPSGKYAGLPGLALPADRVELDRPPKIHYHRSGWVTANLSGFPERRGFRGLPIARLNGAQFFSCTCALPARLAPERARRFDTFAVAHGALPPLAHVQGFLFARRSLRPYLLNQISDDTPISLVQNKHAELAVDLHGHGTDAVIVIRIELDDESPFAGDRAHVWLTGFDT